MDLVYWSIGLLVEFRGGFLCIFGFLWIRNSLLVDEIMVVSFFGLYLKFSGSGSICILVFLFFINFIWIVI